MINGKQVSKEEIQALLGKEIMMYRISTYMWHIKTHANGIVKVIKDGRKVTGYQLINVDEIKAYMKRNDVPTNYVSKLEDLKAAPVEKTVEAPVASDELEVTEVTE